MANLHISYDLREPGRNYEKVSNCIKSLGSWAKIHKSFWYVKSPLTADEAVAKIKAVLDANDLVYVVDASSNHAAWNALPPAVTDHLQTNWLS